MKKLILTALLSLCFVTTALASGNLKTKVNVTPDQLIPGTTYVGSFNGSSISIEKEYLTAIGVRDGSTVTVEFHLGDFTGRYCPTLVSSEYGKFGTVAYNKINNSYKSWSRNNSSSATPISFSGNDAVINSKYFVKKSDWDYRTTSGSACNIGSKLYPAWKFIVYLEIPKSVYDSQIKANLEAWGGSLVVNSSGGSTQ